MLSLPARGELYFPSAFCWSKFAAEAGEPSSSIRARKEAERRQNDGVFLWGIGTSVRPSLPELLRQASSPQVYFSPMHSRPAHIDSKPDMLALWREAIGVGGERYSIPSYSLVTSRWMPGRKNRHYALVCHTQDPLNVDYDDVEIDSSCLRNLRTGTAVGSSQVTAVVRRIPGRGGGRVYRVAFRATLVHPFLVELVNPLVIPDELRIDRCDASDREDTIHRLLELRRGAGFLANQRQLVFA